MPIVRIDIQTGKSTAYKREILRSVRHALVTALGVPDDRIMSRVIETPAENIDAPEVRSDRLTVVEVSMLPGRGAALKQALYAEIVAGLADSPGIHQHDITVLVNDPAAECFAIGGVMQCTLPGPEEPAEEDEETPAEAPKRAPKRTSRKAASKTAEALTPKHQGDAPADAAAKGSGEASA